MDSTIPFSTPFIAERLDTDDYSFRLSGGTYMITDPCYVLDKRDKGDNLWDELCDKAFQDEKGGEVKCGTITITLDGIPYTIWWGCTAYGDGGYQVVKNHFPVGEFDVDAGLFAIFPIEFIKKFRPEMMESKSAVILEMDGNLVEYKNGNMDCGRVSVTTDGQDEEEALDEEDEVDEDGNPI